MKPAFLIGIALVLMIGAVLAIGSALPATRAVTTTRTLPAPPALVHATILDVSAQPDWRSNVRAVEVDTTGTSWTEVTGSGERIRFQLASQAPDRITLTFESPHGYTGRWEARLSAAEAPTPAGATTITVQEQATTPSPIGRIISRLLFDQQAFATIYLDELAAEVARRQPSGT